METCDAKSIMQEPQVQQGPFLAILIHGVSKACGQLPAHSSLLSMLRTILMTAASLMEHQEAFFQPLLNSLIYSQPKKKLF